MLGSHLHSLLFAQIFGLYFVIISVVFLSRAEYYKALMAKTKAPGIELMGHGLVCLFISLFLVTVHNIWELQPRVIVTILCWFFLVRSVLCLSMPVRSFNWFKKLWAGNGHRYLFVFLMFFGMYLITRGFYIFMQQVDKTPMWMFTFS